MDDGIRIASEAMTNGMHRQEMYAHNSSNINTPFFKENLTYYTQNKEGVSVLNQTINHAQGPLMSSDDNMDLAMKDGKFLRVSNDDGDIFYIKGGHMSVNTYGELNYNGYKLLDINDNPIVINNTEEFQVLENGRVVQNGLGTYMLNIIEVDKGSTVTKVGHNVYSMEDKDTMSVSGYSHILQGFQEGSNVDRAKTMTEMINVLRTYESNQKSLVAIDEVIGRTVNELPKF